MIPATAVFFRVTDLLSRSLALYGDESADLVMLFRHRTRVAGWKTAMFTKTT